MKLRIKGDSLRLRLTRSEIGQIASAGVVSETMHLSGASLSYALHSDSDTGVISARLKNSHLTVVLPETLMRSWANSEQVSLRGQDGPLQILVEKDFSCLQPREGEDDSDAFPHPDQSVDD